MIILKDISELVRGEYLRTVEKVTDTMIASTSHDMRTPLNPVINMIKLVISKI
jgi:K+-sensing histidine kinase KdpD